MLVSTHLPPFTAAKEEPLPRWQVTTLNSGSPSRPQSRAASAET